MACVRGAPVWDVVVGARCSLWTTDRDTSHNVRAGRPAAFNDSHDDLVVRHRYDRRTVLVPAALRHTHSLDWWRRLQQQQRQPQPPQQHHLCVSDRHCRRRRQRRRRSAPLSAHHHHADTMTTASATLQLHGCCCVVTRNSPSDSSVIDRPSQTSADFTHSTSPLLFRLNCRSSQTCEENVAQVFSSLK